MPKLFPKACETVLMDVFDISRKAFPTFRLKEYIVPNSTSKQILGRSRQPHPDVVDVVDNESVPVEVITDVTAAEKTNKKRKPSESKSPLTSGDAREGKQKEQ